MVFTKTQEGLDAFKLRSKLLSARQRTAFILFDGVKSVQQIVAATAGLGITQADIDDMIANGLVEDNASAPTVPVIENKPATAVETTVPAALAPTPGGRTPQERFAQAWPIATKLTASLGLRGFRLNLAIEAVSGYDGLLALFPKIQAAVGVEKCDALEKALKA